MSGFWKKSYEKIMYNSNISTPERPFIYIVSDEEFMIENHKGIIEYNADMIIVCAGNYYIKVVGDNLSIESITSENMRICGKIMSVEYDRS